VNTAPGRWSVRLPWPRQGQTEGRLDLAADAEARAGAAQRLAVVSVERLEARLDWRAWLDGLEVRGRVEAAVTRECGVSLEPLEERVSEAVEVRALPPGSPNLPARSEGEVTIDLDAPDPPEVGVAAGFDIADVLEEIVALALDPYPRKPGAVFEPPADAGETSAFAALSQLTTRAPPDR
jgi:hypothetical protein